MSDQDSNQPIAVVGVSALFPGSIDKHGFWKDILAGRDLITDVPPSHWLIEDYYDPDPNAPDKTYAHRGAFLPDVDFDPVAWGVPPSIVPATDTTQLLALIVARQVLEDACGGDFSGVDRERVSVILGVTSAQELLGSMVSRLQRPVWVKSLREMGLPEEDVQQACERIASHYVSWQESTFPGVLGNVVAGRIANRLDLGGTNCVTDAACASTFSALSMAVAELRLGQADLVITGGADTMNDIFMYMCFSKTPALSPSGDCRPFSDQADGTLLGEGIGMVALKRLRDAERDRDRIYAVIKGVGSSSDGRAKSVYAPVPEGQAKALRRAYQQAGYQPDTVGLVEAHGTGTRAGDAAEFAGLQMVFDEASTTRRQWCALGSVKSQVGHTKAAAGAAGLFKAVMALHHKVLPPTIKVDRPNPGLKLPQSPFYINTRARPWIRHPQHPRRAAVSSFGFGGSNFHLTLEEYEGTAAPAARIRTQASELVLLSAQAPVELARVCRDLIGDTEDADRLRWLAWSTQQNFNPDAPARLAIEATSDADLTSKLRMAADMVERGQAFSSPNGVHFGTDRQNGQNTRQETRQEGKVALLFPGQGSQYIDMGADLVMHLPAARRIWDQAARWLEPLLPDQELQRTVFPLPAFDDQERAEQKNKLTDTRWAQPALGITSWCLLELLHQLGIRGHMAAGHSFGEVTALLAAGRLSPEDFLRVACQRGRLMAEAAHTPGAMLSVVATADEARDLIRTWNEDVVIANHNGPRQIVLSGPTAAIERCAARLAEKNVSTTRLNVATAFHSPVVSDSVTPFSAFLDTISVATASIDVYGNTHAAPYPADAAMARAWLAAQLAQPVRFVDQIETMYAAGARTFIEVGPGTVLTNLVSRILGSRPHLGVPLDRQGRSGLSTLNQALASMAAAGVRMDLSVLWEGHDPPSDPRAANSKSPKPRMTLKIRGCSYDKPYPPPEGAAALPKPNPPTKPSRLDAEPANHPDPHGTAPAPVSSTADASVQLAWVQAFQETQRQTAEAHAAYQRAMAETHAAFLRASEASLAALGGLLNVAPGAPMVVPPPAAALAPIAVPAPLPFAVPPAPSPFVPAPSPTMPTPAFAPAPTAMATAPTVPPVFAPAPTAMAMAPGLSATNAGAAATPSQSVLQPAAKGAPPNFDLTTLILAVVAEKTGYPPDMLGLDMNLEGDLGIDSIKRVEILSAVSQKAPQLPEFNAADLAGLHTLGEIIAFLSGRPDPDGPQGSRTSIPTTTEDGPGSSASATPAIEAIDGGAIGRYGLRRLPAPAAGFVTAGLLSAQRVVVTDEGTGVAAALVERLRKAKVRAEAVTAVPADADAVIFLGGLRPMTNPEQGMAINQEAFRAARVVAGRFAKTGGVFVSVQDTGGDFGLSGSDRAWAAGLAALARTARLEWPTACVRALDVERAHHSPSELAEVIATEIMEGGGDVQAALAADGTRTVLESYPEPIPAEAAGALPLDEHAVVVASGGARGVTAACLTALARTTRCRFLLLGRSLVSPEPPSCQGMHDETAIMHALRAAAGAEENLGPAELRRRAQAVLAAREIKDTIEAMEAAGAEVLYRVVDITDTEQVQTAVDEARMKWGAITALIHGAGVLNDKLIADKSDQQFDRVFDTKVRGLQALLAATRDDKLRAIVLFSSIAARSGNRGQCDYAMANEILNQIARIEQRRRGPGVVVRSVGWGPWDGGMVTSSLKAHFAAQGVPIIPVTTGADLFLAELTAPAACITPVLSGKPPGRGLFDLHGQVTTTLQILVDQSRYPFLVDHAIAGTPVVPVALAVDWMARAATVCRPELKVSSCQGLRVLRGIRLNGFAGDGDRLTLTARQLANGSSASIAIEILGADGGKHYAATIEMKPRLSIPTHGPPRIENLEALAGPVYDSAIGDVLFHGPHFQVLRQVHGPSEDGAQADLIGIQDSDWPGWWQTDPALLDGGLQLALLWTRRVLGTASLPTAVQEYRNHREGPVRGPFHAVLKAIDHGHDRAQCDVFFVAADGSLIAELRGVQTHRLPRSRSHSETDAQIRP